jgi:hypothetical protein
MVSGATVAIPGTLAVAVLTVPQDELDESIVTV